MAMVLKVAGVIWCSLVASLIVASLCMILLNKGVSELWAIMSPFNVLNYVVMFISFAPGFLMLWGSDKISGKA